MGRKHNKTRRKTKKEKKRVRLDKIGKNTSKWVRIHLEQKKNFKKNQASKTRTKRGKKRKKGGTRRRRKKRGGRLVPTCNDFIPNHYYYIKYNAGDVKEVKVKGTDPGDYQVIFKGPVVSIHARFLACETDFEGDPGIRLYAEHRGGGENSYLILFDQITEWRRLPARPRGLRAPHQKVPPRVPHRRQLRILPRRSRPSRRQHKERYKHHAFAPSFLEAVAADEAARRAAVEIGGGGVPPRRRRPAF